MLFSNNKFAINKIKLINKYTNLMEDHKIAVIDNGTGYTKVINIFA